MCFFKKKKTIEVATGKYQVGDFVSFPYRGEMSPGMVYGVNKDEQGNIIYSIQIGGECPAIIRGVKEDTIHLRKKA